MHLGVMAIAAVASVILIPAASASVIGPLDVANCPGGGVTVTTTTIDWLLPAGPPDGCINTGTGTAVLFGPTLSSTLGPGVAGRIMDLTIGGGVVPDFMTFVVGAD